MDSRAIEMRLRLPAPDEPAVLPPLVLPAFDRLGRVSPAVRFREGPASRRDPRFAFAIALLALAAAAVIITGALRLLDDRTTPVNRLQWPPEGVLGVQDGFTMEWPESWARLAEGGLYQGDFTQDGISYERVALVTASTPLGGCPSPATSAGPRAVPSGDPVQIPGQQPDLALACMRAAVLPAGAVRIIAEVGERSAGLSAPEGPAIADQSEPTLESGWTEVIDGQPARLTLITGSVAEAHGATETRVWDVIFPGTIDHLLRIHADIAGPDLGAGRAAVQAVIDSIDFATEPPSIDGSTAATVLVRAIDELDRSARRSQSDFYACFPREPGEIQATIRSGPYERLAEPVGVTCATTISASRAGVWRVTLTVHWDAGAGYGAGGLVQELFLKSDGGLTGGGYLRSLDVDGNVIATPTVALPEPPRTLPDPVEGPLGLAAGTFVELLWPGIYPAESPGGVSSDLYPSGVGWRLYVIDSPELIDGVEWYPVHGEEGSWETFTRWVPATRDGRPTIAAVEPSCRTGEPDLQALMWLTNAEHLECFGNRQLTLGPVIATASNPGSGQCADAGFEPTTCPDAGNLSWLEADPMLELDGLRGPSGPVPALAIWADPGGVGVIPAGTWLRVTGHFDDSLASDCRDGPTGVPVDGADALRDLVLNCRERFVVTGFERVAAP